MRILGIKHLDSNAFFVKWRLFIVPDIFEKIEPIFKSRYISARCSHSLSAEMVKKH